MPAGSAVKAWSAAARRPSTSTMSRDGAPRAKEIVAAMATKLRNRRPEQVHVKDGAVLAGVFAQAPLLDAGQRRERPLEPPQRLGPRKRARGDGHRRRRAVMGGEQLARRGQPPRLPG